MTDAGQRTAADDDLLLERLHDLAWRSASSGGSAAGPPFPPLTPTEVERAERRLGYRLPELLRRLYTEVGDGGFGPEGGLASLTPRRVPHWNVPDWPCATTIRDDRPGWAPPKSWFYLTDGGCTMEWYVSLIAVDHPVLLWDADGWSTEDGQGPHDGLRYATPSLRQWLWTWADGGHVWDEVLAWMDGAGH
ncbi:SMI1/KNR4 family protein [Streptomyces sp. WAC07149]|uniref:SMI1/KNR4 family protein n=1 Tax=Streptomyces sp. WAC07149 TaxID=2487425 RepID=UPI000F78ECC0|nr:SMI1/KNR4 family protein [Streptomyces sp. WAC07149]RST03108.1 SMI1/KNR4 family protein [Streptomyces sp. WAC07149]